VNSVNGIDFRSGEVGHDVYTVKKVAGEFLEILDLANLIHFVNNSIQDGFNFLVRLLLKERPLAFQPTLVPQEFFLVKGGDVFFSTLCNCHEGRTITPHRVSLQVSF
jgi:hypothetical protein